MSGFLIVQNVCLEPAAADDYRETGAAQQGGEGSESTCAGARGHGNWLRASCCGRGNLGLASHFDNGRVGVGGRNALVFTAGFHHVRQRVAGVSVLFHLDGDKEAHFLTFAESELWPGDLLSLNLTVARYALYGNAAGGGVGDFDIIDFCIAGVFYQDLVGQ